MASNNNKNGAAKKALCLAVGALAISSAQCCFTPPIPILRVAAVKGGSSVSAQGPEASVTSGNGALAFRRDGGTDWSLTNSATWASGGLFGGAGGNSGATAATSQNTFVNSFGMTDTEAVQSDFHYDPMGSAKSYFDATAASLLRPIEVAAGDDVAIVTPHFSGASASSGAGVSKSEPGLQSTLYDLVYRGGGALKPTAIDVGVPSGP